MILDLQPVAIVINHFNESSKYTFKILWKPYKFFFSWYLYIFGKSCSQLKQAENLLYLLRPVK